MSVEINDELYDKMLEEKERFREELLSMEPEEILDHAWEYTAREDILMAVEHGDMEEGQAKALLSPPSPLADVMKEYRKQEVNNGAILAALEDAAKLHMEPPIYRQSVQHAMEHGEREAYFASRRVFEACGNAIDESVNSHFDGMHLPDSVVRDVLTKYSAERVTLVLARTVQGKEWDLRFSRANREWARTVDTSCIGKEPYYCMATAHPAILDGFISLFRKQVLEKGKAPQAHKKPAKHPQERGDGFEL
ncbi:DUF3849 domain-containing protein [Neglecta sp. X4]|uniref:DUF3849 domain-containing protein n=1 Tax=unclassified Neglectibacter TaxID=2632164 RepID=UPI0013695D03|nr:MULTISPECIES: DUF3849 domain-containing protein [unclassified Neglectibacter]NBI18784.1 DUF3849 domain-containing protein [Neglectibacter sp. 59]NBJ74450.1 DUF3849 domain-containing protein [Neglectibacter sp. X4]NCE82275.1 DUF3849 domain-containing protein [Neglectibacter sp. X58]